MPFQKSIALDSVLPISGMHIKQSFCQEQHRAVGKETGGTAHVERWNTTLRQRLGRCVRKTLSFSKSSLIHTACLDLFLQRYHVERAISFM
jgi:IS1 family transposase